MRNLTASFDEMLSCLAEQWSGEAATQVIDASKPFQQWLVDLDKQISNVEEAILQLMAAFRHAHSDVVDPELIDANRAQVVALINDNELGLNTPEISALEDEYGRYWDQDGRAMTMYRVRLSVARRMLRTPWQQPPPIASNTGLVQPVPLAADRETQRADRHGRGAPRSRCTSTVTRA
ncbi:hypothetical protein B586_04760 [Mycobacterium haemophilum DSM 44634]|nr:hypothetical protein B586_04760 [Mycobacterium haemophilum DSM 44634]